MNNLLFEGQVVKRSIDFEDLSLTDKEREQRLFAWIARIGQGIYHAVKNRRG